MFVYNIYCYSCLLGEVGRDLMDGTAGVRKTSNTRSVVAPLNSILVWLSLADGEQLRTTWNLGGYIPSSSSTSSSSLVVSQNSLTKKSTSLIKICRNRNSVSLYNITTFDNLLFASHPNPPLSRW